MDIQKIITDAVAKLTGNNDLIKQFTADPAKALKSLGINFPADKLAEIVSGITSKLGIPNIDLNSLNKTGLLAKIKAFFSKK